MELCRAKKMHLSLVEIIERIYVKQLNKPEKAGMTKDETSAIEGVASNEDLLIRLDSLIDQVKVDAKESDPQVYETIKDYKHSSLKSAYFSTKCILQIQKVKNTVEFLEKVIKSLDHGTEQKSAMIRLSLLDYNIDLDNDLIRDGREMAIQLFQNLPEMFEKDKSNAVTIVTVVAITVYAVIAFMVLSEKIMWVFDLKVSDEEKLERIEDLFKKGKQWQT